MTEDIEKKRDERKKQTAEVFTPPKLVRQMLNKLPTEVWKKGKTFIDPACGNGNFLIAVLHRKIERGHNVLEALLTIYGVDIMADNVQECRLKLLKLISLYETVTAEHIVAVIQNIVYININNHPGGSLDYDFAFDNKANSKHVERWVNWIVQGKLEEINLPVDEENLNGQQLCF
jgi:predicted RNA methylase